MRGRYFSKDSLVSTVHVWTMNQIKASVNLQRDIWYFQMHNISHKSICKTFSIFRQLEEDPLQLSRTRKMGTVSSPETGRELSTSSSH